jgi:glycosyltransferase involved in cell wall biosynthesis
MGIDVLLDAWATLDRELPDGSMLLIVGDGPQREELALRVEEPGLAGRARVLARVADSELPDVYRAADVAAVPSVALEGFGLVALEAAACGTPTVVSNVGGLPEAVFGLDPTLVVAAGDAAAWADRLRRAANGALPGRDATRRFAEGFDWQSVAERHRALYRRVCAGARDERLRVVYLDHIARLSGGEIALLRLLPHLTEVNAHVILGEEGPLVDRLHHAGVSVEVLPIAANARDLRKDALRLDAISPVLLAHSAEYIVRLARRLRRLKPDLVHANSLKSGVYGAFAARAAHVPLVWHVHDRISNDYLPAAAAKGVRFLARRLSDAVVANSASTLDTLDLRGHPQISAVVANVLVIPPPHDRDRSPARPIATTFGMVGRIAPWKGQDFFLRAFAQAFPDGAQRAIIVGSAMFGEADFERSLAVLAAELGIDSRVEFRGFRDDVFGELSGFDVLVHASITPEPFGQVVLEGMAVGLPVIAPDDGGPAELIDDGKTGRLFRRGDAASLALALRELADKPDLRKRLGTAAAAAAGAYTPELVVGTLLDVYGRVLASS